MRRHNELADLRAYRPSPTIPTARSLVLGTRPRLRALMTKSPGTNTATPTIKTNLTSTTNEPNLAFKSQVSAASVKLLCNRHVSLLSVVCLNLATALSLQSVSHLLSNVAFLCSIRTVVLCLSSPLLSTPSILVYLPHTVHVDLPSRLSLVLCFVFKMLDVPCNLLSSASSFDDKCQCHPSCNWIRNHIRH